MGQASTRLLVYAGAIAAGVGTVAYALTSGHPKVKAGDRVFLVGDSMAVGLATPLQALATDHKVAFSYMAKEGTRIDQWASNEGLYKAVSEFKPTVILVSLGTNDEYMKLDARVQQALPLRTLLARLRAVAPVVWIGPPKLPATGAYAWTKTNGAIPLILENVPSSHYFPSHKLTIPREPDLLHPNLRGKAGWAGEIWKYLS